MHAILSELNKQDIHQYARLVKLLATVSLDELKKLIPLYTWIVSCASHTMHRFVKAINKLALTQQQKELVCFAFSVMMNSTDLETLCSVFTQLATALLLPSLTSTCADALEFWTTLSPNAQLTKLQSKKFSVPSTIG